MTAPAKFLFDTDFGRGAGRSSDSVVGHQVALAEAEARGYRLGFAAAKTEASETERQLASALSRTSASMETLAQGLKAIEGRLEAEAVEVALEVAKKLSAALMQREPFAEVAALAAECFAHLIGAPHVVVRVDESVYASASARLQEIASACGFDGRLVVLGDPDLDAGDCRIEWADGGVVRNRNATEAVITEAVNRYLRVRRSNDIPLSSVGVSGDG